MRNPRICAGCGGESPHPVMVGQVEFEGQLTPFCAVCVKNPTVVRRNLPERIVEAMDRRRAVWKGMSKAEREKVKQRVVQEESALAVKHRERGTARPA